jgi:GTP-binding protein
MTTTANIRNIAIIAHVDHGKTTLVDQLFRQSGTLSASSAGEERMMDNLELEKERGITIAAKNCSVKWEGTKINILDTPGHADFGGEVERALMMVDGAVLLVDSAEGPLPQTRFVLGKALARSLPLIVVVNKIDRKDSRPKEVLDAVYDLFIDLGANEDQLEFPVIYAIGRDGIASRSLEQRGTDLSPLFSLIVDHIPPPAPLVSIEEPDSFRMVVLDLGYSNYLGRLAVGKVLTGSAKSSDRLVCLGMNGSIAPIKSAKLQVYEGLSMIDINEAPNGEIVIVGGAEAVTIGDTIAAAGTTIPLPRVTIDEPTIAMRFSANDSPFSGRDGKFVQPQRIYERLYRETLRNVSLVLEGDASGSSFVVKGRGEFQMAILVETMRREGYEVQLGRPQVIMRQENGTTFEPIEHVTIDTDEQYVGVVTEKLSRRKGRLVNLVHGGTGRSKLEFSVPSRGLIGYRNEFLTDTRGTGILHAYVEGYEEFRGEVISRVNGSLVADRFGDAVAYALFNLEPRGRMFVKPGEPVYPGMVIGEHNRDNDLLVNPCKTKKLTNIRAAGRDENVTLTPITPITLEQAIEFIADDELVEVTPNAIRIRKIELPRARGD